MMLKLNKMILSAAAFAALGATAAVTFAQETFEQDNFWQTPTKEYWKDPFDKCIRTARFDEGGFVPPECGGARAATRAPAEAPAAPTRLTLSADTHFDFDSAQLKPAGKAELDRLAQGLRDAAAVSNISVVGHTDSIGTDAYNQSLSERRAASVREYLVSVGVPSGVIQTQGMGESQPVAPNTTPDGRDNPEGRAQNRRVEIAVQATQPTGRG
ncbi:MAG: OmpA family protein [Pseudomonadota bacterium]|nr:OmpA family protein [Pseudomonadota bacterium]